MIGYGIASNPPLLVGDGVSAVAVAGTRFGIVTPVAVVLRGALASRDFLSYDGVEDSVD
jgi:hypothetical protein